MASQPPELSPTTRMWAKSICGALAVVWDRKDCRSLCTHFHKSDMSVRMSVPVASGIRRKSAETIIAPLRRARSRIQFVKNRGGARRRLSVFCVSERNRDLVLESRH